MHVNSTSANTSAQGHSAQNIERVVEQLKLYSNCVFEPDDIVEVRCIPSNGDSPAQHWCKASELPMWASQLLDDNAQDWHICGGANPRRDSGGSKIDDVKLARCLFVDFDKTTPEAARELMQRAGLPEPTLFLNSGHGAHAYWRLEEPVEDLEDWRSRQKDLIAHLDTDKAIHDPPRVMRLPGFVNHKAPPAACFIVEANPDRRFALADLARCIPPPPKTAAAPTHSVANVSGNLAIIARAATYLSRIPGVPQGGRNAAAMYCSALLTRDFDLSDSEARPLMEAWNDQNSPPLDDAELQRCLQNGRKYGNHAIGCKRATRGNIPTFGTAVHLSDYDAELPTVLLQPTDAVPPDGGPPWHTIDEIGAMPTYTAGLPPVSTGYDVLDNALRGGFRPECVNILAGRSGFAKSTLITNIVRRVALNGETVLLFKLEESATEATWRMHAAAAQVPLNRLLDANGGLAERRALEDAWRLLSTLPIRISNHRHIDDIERIGAEHVASNGKLIVLDQLSMVDAPGCEIGYQRATEVSKRLRLLARELHVPIVLVSQVNRPASKDSKSRLSMHDLRDSGCIENDAAIVILIDKVSEPGAKCLASDPLTLELLVAKNRYGPTTRPKDRPLELLWWPQLARIEDPPTTPVVANVRRTP